MEIIIIPFLIVIFFVISTQKAYSSPADSLLLKLTIANVNVRKYKDLVIDLEIQTQYKKAILLPRHLSWGFLNDSLGTGYVSIQLQKKDGNKNYESIPLEGIIDNVPILSLDTLRFNDIKKEDFFFGRNFKSDMGEYRVRVLCFASRDNQDVGNVYSNWVYFRCSKKIEW